MPVSSALRNLAEAYGVRTSYEDDRGHGQEAAPEALLAALRVLGAPLERVEDAEAALRERQQAQWQAPVEPVVVAWDGRAGELGLRLPAREAAGTFAGHLELESGESRSWSCPLADLPVAQTARVEGADWEVRRLELPGPLPLGYHRLSVELPGRRGEAVVVSAPARAWAGAPDRTWGVFLPVYAIRSARNWGAGDFTDLEALIEWTHRQGGGVVGTLPLLAAFLGESGEHLFEPSPYSPASRMFWNEFYLDPERVPDLARSPAARALLDSPEFRRECADLRAAELVDHGRVMALKRRVLGELARSFFAQRPGGGGGHTFDAFRRFVAGDERVEDYARFRAVCERFQASWWTWPDRLRAGVVQEGDYDEHGKDYHLYVQWLADEQLRALSERAREKGPGLYLDYPLGVSSDSYDVWRDRPSFAMGVSAGAPPDVFFTRGQDWGFPPLHPENIRKRGYRYLRDCLAHHLRYAGLLRIDHMMGLHRFYWVPHGLGPRQGVYVRYPAEELYAVFSLESNRHRAVLFGEDLGTVPPAVRPAMTRHRVHRLYVVQYELCPDPEEPLPPVPGGALAGMNTHDMPTFAAYWEALDVADRQALGLLDEAGSEDERRRRQEVREALVRTLRAAGLLGERVDLETVLRACLVYLAGSDAQAVLANLEDLWQETQPQNVPGTWRERPNWRRKARHGLETLDQVPGLSETMPALNRAVREKNVDKIRPSG